MQSTITATECESHGNHDNDEYDRFMGRLTERFRSNSAGGPLFATSATGLWDAYLASFDDPAERQYHNCNACRRFVDRFGGLATLSASGAMTPAMWDESDAPEAYKPAVAAMHRLVRRSKVAGVFLSSDYAWGTPVTGEWHHLAITPEARMVFRRSTQTAGQAMAEKTEDFKTVMTALNEYTKPVIEKAVDFLRTDSLYRSEKVLGQAEWLLALHGARTKGKGGARANAVWLAVATAPAGFCHPRSSMIGTLLDDIASGMVFDRVSRRFAEKMHPLSYQRPKAAPASGAITRAEKIIAQLGAQGSLARRFARIEDVQAIWMPKATAPPAATNGVFWHLAPKNGSDAAPSIVAPPVVMTWDKFSRMVLPTAERIEILAPSHGSYSALVTASNPDAPPILQWDAEDRRNPVSWYFWDGGSNAEQFCLAGGRYYPVTAVCLKPSMWNGGFEHQGNGVMFIIDGARDTRNTSLALFPEILKSEFSSIRSVLEAYSASRKIEGQEEQSASGLMLGGKWDSNTIRVWSDGRRVDYRLDRWD